MTLAGAMTPPAVAAERMGVAAEGMVTVSVDAGTAEQLRLRTFTVKGFTTEKPTVFRPTISRSSGQGAVETTVMVTPWNDHGPAPRWASKR